MTLLTIDFESFFSKDCGFNKLSTSQYVQYPDFHIHCMGYKTPNMPCAKVLRGDSIQRFFDFLRNKPVVLSAHNMYFDGYIARHLYNYVPRRYVCTMSMAKALVGQYQPVSLESLASLFGLGDGKMKNVLDKWKGKTWAEMSPADRLEIVQYCALDVDLTEQLFFIFAKEFPKFEYPVLDLTLRAFCQPVLQINKEKASVIIDFEQNLKRESAAAAGADPADLRSNPKFAALLEAEGVDVPMKISPTTGKETYAFSKNDLSFQALADQGNEKVKRLVEARIANKSSINETRAKAMLDRSDSAVPIYLGYCGAHTFRWTGGDNFNPQNMPRDGRLRECIEAPDGYSLVIADSAQIEARDNAVFSEQWDLVEEFAQGVDVYSSFASDIYGYEVIKDTHPNERFVGKTGILGLGYQCGANKFQNMLEVGAFGPKVSFPFDQVQKIVDTYRTKYYAIKNTWWELQNMIPSMLDDGREIEFRGLVFKPSGRLLMPNGLHMHYPGLHYQVDPTRGTAEFTYNPYDGKYRKIISKKIYGGALLENIIQSRCRTMVAEQASILAKYYRVALLVHDEIVLCVPNNKADTAMKDILEVMSTPPDWNPKIPLDAEGKITKHYVK